MYWSTKGRNPKIRHQKHKGEVHMGTKYLARITEDGREQTLKNHLEGVAARCAAFCEPFGSKEQGFFAGLTHDLPKYSVQAQKRLRGGPIVDHMPGTRASSAGIRCNEPPHRAARCRLKSGRLLKKLFFWADEKSKRENQSRI